MAEYRYLKNESYYNDLYDLHTIETCLDYYWNLKDSFEKNRTHKDFKKYTKEKFDKEVKKIASYTINTIKIERYRHKKETIQEWMDVDRQRQDRLDNAVELNNINCPQCNQPMHFGMKSLEDFTNEPMRMLLFYECSACKKRRGVYDDGKEHVSKSLSCPKCRQGTKISYKKNGNVLIWTTDCSSCGYKEVYRDDFDKWEADRKKKEERERLLLKKYRRDFCYSDEVGQQAIWDSDQLKALVDQWKEREEHKDEYDFVASIKKLTVVELEKLLNDTVNSESYIRLELSKPEFGKQLIVGFTVQDSNTTRQEYDSCHGLKKLIQEALDDTNWRLMSEGVTYRLGYLKGRLKAFETQADLLALVRTSYDSVLT